MLFQDVGAAGRIPVLCPVTWIQGFPVFGHFGGVPRQMRGSYACPDYAYAPLTGSDDFHHASNADGKLTLKPFWQWNHNPEPALWTLTERQGALRIRTGKLCKNVTQATNTLTQRTLFPSCHASVTIDANGLQNGDFAGFVALQGCYGMIAVTSKEDRRYIVLLAKPLNDRTLFADGVDDMPGEILASVETQADAISFRIDVEYGEQEDFAYFFYSDQGEWIQLGEKHALAFKLDHFTGCRFALSLFSTQETGGHADFLDFRYNA